MPDIVPSKPILQTDADPTVTRIFPQLAAEIGLNESIVLLQIAHWIKTANNLRDGQWWTYQSVREMKKKAFPYWSAPTISRIVNKLAESGYIHINDEYNEKRYDKTRWYALNPAKLQLLKGIALRYEDMSSAKVDKVVSKRDTLLQNETGVLQDDTRFEQNETTIPEITTETTTEKEREAAHDAQPAPQAASVSLSPSKPEPETPTAPERDVTPHPVSEIRKIARDAFTLQNTLNPVIETYLSCFPRRQQNRSIRTSEKSHESAERILELFTLDEVKALVMDKRKTNSGYPFGFLEGDLAKWAAEKESPVSTVPAAPSASYHRYTRINPDTGETETSDKPFTAYSDDLPEAS